MPNSGRAAAVRTRELGFEATDAEVLEAIRQVPAFQVGGKFSPDAYHAALRSINMSPERFESEQREYVLARQLDRGLYSSAFVLPRTSILQVPVRSMEEMAVLTLPCVARQLKVTRQIQAIPSRPALHRAPRDQRARSQTGRKLLPMSKRAPTE